MLKDAQKVLRRRKNYSYRFTRTANKTARVVEGKKKGFLEQKRSKLKTTVHTASVGWEA